MGSDPGYEIGVRKEEDKKSKPGLHKATTMDDLPDELLEDILRLIVDQKTLHSLSLTSRRVNRVVLPLLYKRFSHRMFEKPKRLHAFLRAIVKNPDLAEQTEIVELLDPIQNGNFWDLDSWKNWARMYYLPNVNDLDRYPLLTAAKVLCGAAEPQKDAVIEREEAQAALMLCLVKNVTHLVIQNPVAAASQVRFRMDNLLMDLLHPQIRRGAALQHLQVLHVTAKRLEGGQGGFRLSAIAPFFRLPKLSMVKSVVCHEPEDEDFAGFDCPPDGSNVAQLVFESSALCPAAFQMMLRACRCVEVFECDWAGVAVGWVEINYPLLREGLDKHRKSLKRIRLDARKYFDSWPEQDIGLVEPMGTFEGYTALTYLEGSASALIGWDEDAVGNYKDLAEVLPPNIEEIKLNQLAPRLYEHISALAEVCAVRYPRLRKMTVCDSNWSEELLKDLRDRFESMAANVEVLIEDGVEIDHFN